MRKKNQCVKEQHVNMDISYQCAIISDDEDSGYSRNQTESLPTSGSVPDLSGTETSAVRIQCILCDVGYMSGTCIVMILSC